jgi:hypothetical protein
LGKFHYEIVDMPADEFDYWCAYFKIKAEEEKKALQKKGKKGSNVPPRQLPKKERK